MTALSPHCVSARTVVISLYYNEKSAVRALSALCSASALFFSGKINFLASRVRARPSLTGWVGAPPPLSGARLPETGAKSMPLAELACLECGGRRGIFVTGDRVYPHRPDLAAKRFWRCECGAFVGCHANSGKPLGRPASQVTKRARRAAHDAFDRLWAPGLMNVSSRRFSSRGEAYAWLAQELGIDRCRCHIGEMDAQTAQRVVAIVEGSTDACR